MRNLVLLAVSVVASFSFSFAQQSTDSLRLIQLSGVVVSSDSLEQMPYATIFDKTVGRGTLADFFGFFSIVVQPGDTILVRYFGHNESSFIVPDTLTDDRYSIIHMMVKDTSLNYLPTVTVYPWPSRADFARAFVEMDPYDDAFRQAQKKLSGESLAFIASKVSSDGSISYGYAINQQNTRLYTMGQSPVNNLMNPFAWASFLQSWRSGQLSKQ
ncbi:MAG: hypothetical protein HYZ43_01420 [Flavobacteriia bacterium]|nr:hypothetical protein [Flavobacteriia bacterium]